MSRYIDLQEFEERIKKYIKPETLEEKALLEWCKDECIRQAYCMPTADVVEVRHGEWQIVDSDIGYYELECSLCKNKLLFNTDDGFTYCPHCGAKMDGERREG